MMVRRAAIKRVVDSVADGTGEVDWGAVESQLASDRDHALLRELRILDRISHVQRSHGELVDENTLKGQAKIIARVFPIDARSRLPRSATLVAADGQVVLQEATLPEPTRWGRLELLECIGEGTFGEIYRAFDTQLRREVAVKLLRTQTTSGGRAARMLEEARLLARVHHPNVVIVYDADEVDGRAGICMEFVRGRDLEQILVKEGTRSAREAAAIGEDLCEALSAVHNAGLVHRDVKAQNVMREDGGRIVLMDFGAGQEQGTTSRLTGTPLYLAPEVLNGEKASVRSDIYSVGVLLYHLVTNDFPVRGQSYEELREAHHERRVHRLRDLAPMLPRWFVRVVERAIAPNPQDRFATVGELEAALAQRQPFTTKYLMLAAAVTLLASAGAFAMWRSSSGADTLTPLVAVLPLDEGPGVERHMADAIGDEIYQGLAMIDTLRVTSPQSAAHAKADRLTMRQAASQLRATAVVAGTVSGLDQEQFEVKLRLFRAGSDTSMWADVFQTSRATLSSFRRTTAQALAHVMKAEVSPQVLAKLNRPASTRTDAFDAYARGRSLLARGSRSDLEQAQRELEQSTTFDPTFAPAYAALARVHLDLGANGRRSEWMAQGPLASAAADQALALDPELAEAHAVLGQVAFLFNWDWERAERSFRRAMSLNLSDTFSRERYAQYLAARGRVNEALDLMEETRLLNPYSEGTTIVMVSILQYARRFHDAEIMTLALRPRAPNRNAVHSQLGRIFAATGRFDRAIEEFQKRTDAASGSAITEAEIASAHAGAGRVLEAQAILDRLIERSQSEEIPPELFALISTALGRTDDAFRYLEEAVQLRTRRILWLKVDPRWDPLRSHPHFQALIRRLGL
jgi:tetratricopeptide (TPR) repeat protein